mgnify:CR=1 FL=1
MIKGNRIGTGTNASWRLNRQQCTSHAAKTLRWSAERKGIAQ